MWSSLRTKRKDRIRGSDKSKKRERSLVRILAAVLVLFLFPVTSFASSSGHTGSGTGRHDGNVFTFYYDYDASQDAIVLTVRTTHPTNTYGRKTSHTYNYTDKTNVPSNSPHIAAGHTMADAMNQASTKWNVSGWETALGQPSTTVDGQISGYERGGDQNQIWYVKGNHSRILTFYRLNPDGGFALARTVVRRQSWTCTQDGYTQWSDGSYTDQVSHPGHIESSWQDGGADHYKYCTRNEHGCGHSILSREKHHFGSWTDSGIDHYRTCKDCRHVERGNHSYNAWKDDPDRPGWQKHTCVDCGHPEWRDIEPPTVSVSANPSGKWTAGDVTVTIKAKDRGSGLSSVLLYRTNTLDKTTSCVKTYSFKGQTDEQTCSFTETNEGRFTYYAIASDKSNNKKQSDPTKEAMLDHSDPKQTVFIGGQSTKTETRQGTKKVYQPGAKKTVTETKDVPKVPVYEDATSQINGAGKAVKYNNITYELNGGEATGNTPSDYIHGTETKIGNAKRTGYTFAGWIVTCDGKKLNSTPAKDVIIGSKSTGDLAFSAQWSTIYGIKFDSGTDDAAGTMDPISIGTIQKGQSYTLPKNKFSRIGYTFAGWNDQPDGSGKTYADGATVKDLVDQSGVYAALYAEWKPITYKISYTLNGGSISGQPTSYTYGSTTYIPQPSKSGYVFAGWTINGGSDRYANVTIGSNYQGNVSLSASWEKIQTGSATFTDHETSGGFANINSSIRIWANYIPGNRYLTVTYQLDNVWFGSHPNIGSGFINSSLYVVPTKTPSTPLRTRWDLIADTDNVNAAMADINTWVRQNGLSDGFLAVYQSDKDSGNVGTNGVWTDRKQHSYKIDISSMSAEQSPTILVLAKRWYIWRAKEVNGQIYAPINGHSYVLVIDARHLTAQDLGINLKVVNVKDSITL